MSDPMTPTPTDPLLDRAARAAHRAYRADDGGETLHPPEACQCREGHAFSDGAMCSRCGALACESVSGCPGCNSLMREWDDLLPEARESFAEQVQPVVDALRPDLDAARARIGDLERERDAALDRLTDAVGEMADERDDARDERDAARARVATLEAAVDAGAPIVATLRGALNWILCAIEEPFQWDGEARVAPSRKAIAKRAREALDGTALHPYGARWTGVDAEIKGWERRALAAEARVAALEAERASLVPVDCAKLGDEDTPFGCGTCLACARRDVELLQDCGTDGEEGCGDNCIACCRRVIAAQVAERASLVAEGRRAALDDVLREIDRPTWQTRGALPNRADIAARVRRLRDATPAPAPRTEKE